MKPILVGIGYVALGLLGIWIVGMIYKGGNSAGMCTAVLSVMILFASYLSYDLGRRDGKKSAKVTLGQVADLRSVSRRRGHPEC